MTEHTPGPWKKEGSSVLGAGRDVCLVNMHRNRKSLSGPVPRLSKPDPQTPNQRHERPMRTTAIIEGLTILEKYRDRPDGYNCGAEHDVLYAYPTDRPLESHDLMRLIELGWFQESQHDEYQDDEETNGEFGPKDYSVEESWTCYV